MPLKPHSADPCLSTLFRLSAIYRSEPLFQYLQAYIGEEVLRVLKLVQPGVYENYHAPTSNMR